MSDGRNHRTKLPIHGRQSPTKQGRQHCPPNLVFSCTYLCSTEPPTISDSVVQQRQVSRKEHIGSSHQQSDENEFSGHACMHILTKQVKLKRLLEGENPSGDTYLHFTTAIAGNWRFSRARIDAPENQVWLTMLPPSLCTTSLSLKHEQCSLPILETSSNACSSNSIITMYGKTVGSHLSRSSIT